MRVVQECSAHAALGVAPGPAARSGFRGSLNGWAASRPSRDAAPSRGSSRAVRKYGLELG
jgi:hypothetical protein